MSPFADLLADAGTPEQYQAIAAELAARLQGDDGNTADPSRQTTGSPPVGAGNAPHEPPEETDLDALLSTGSYRAIANDPALRAEYRRRYGR